jgi:hypothetical protein
LGAALIFPSLALAPPPHGPGPNGPPAGKPHPVANGHPRPPTRLGHPHPGAQPKPPVHYVAGLHYWRPLNDPTPRIWVWGDIGYSYYVGGTPYVVSAPPAVTVVSTTQTEPVESSSQESLEGGTGDRYTQMQELTELVHEWRTMNESPSMHERIPPPGASSEARAIVASIKEENQRFDEAARTAMRNLAAGRSAASEVASARSHIERLIKLVDSLPEPAKGKSAASASAGPASTP